MLTLTLAVSTVFGAASHGQTAKAGPEAKPPTTNSAARYDKHQVIRAHIDSIAQLDFMNSLGAVSLNCVPGIGDMDFIVPPGALNKVRARGISAQVTIDDVQPLIDASVNRIREQAANPALAGVGNWFDDYKTYAQVNAYLNDLAAMRPDLASVITLGTSVENRTIYGLRISSARGPSVKPAMLVDGCQHAREWIAVMVPVYIADYLVRNYDTNPDVQAAVDQLEIFIVPIVNVDGYEYTYDVNGNRMWRKNRRDNGNGSYGVDLNRNWGVNWSGPYSASPDPTSDLYFGSSAFSEPEIDSMRGFITAHPQIRGHIDFHNYGQLVLQPLSGQYDPPPAGFDCIDNLGTAMNAAIYDIHGTPYFNGWGGHLLYLASGVITDWCYSSRNIFSFTIEVRDKGGAGFFLPPEEILPTCEENVGAVLALSRRLIEGAQFDFPGGAPPVVAAETSAPVIFDVHAITSGPLAAGGARLFHRLGDSGPFTETTATDLGGDGHSAMLPAAPCGQVIQYYLQAESQSSAIYRWPADAPAHVFEARAVDSLIEFNFQVDAGWTSSSAGAFNGLWERGVPVASPNWPYDPPADADASGQCFVTGNIDSFFGNGDVDGGSVTLVSPVLDLSSIPGSASAANGGGAVIAYSYFLHIVSVSDDPMVVEINTDGGAGPWTEIARHDENTGQRWRQHAITQAELEALKVSLTSTVQIRFTVTDGSPESIVEGGIDAVRVLTACDGPPPPPPPPCDADVSPEGGNDVVDIDDLVTVIVNWGVMGANPADVTHDHLVNIDDLVAVITAWGVCPQ